MLRLARMMPTIKRDRPYEILPDEPTGASRDHDRVRKAYKIVSK
jgi:hypothetical protein